MKKRISFKDVLIAGGLLMSLIAALAYATVPALICMGAYVIVTLLASRLYT